MGVNKRLFDEPHFRHKRNIKHDIPIEVYFEGEAGAAARAEREKNSAGVEKFNASVRSWGSRVTDALRANMSATMSNSSILQQSLKVNYKRFGKRVQKGQEVTSVGFRFAEQGIYVHLGVGRGYNRQNGTIVVTKKHNRDKILRHPNPWFNPVVERYIPELQNIVKDYCEYMIIDATSIKIDNI